MSVSGLYFYLASWLHYSLSSYQGFKLFYNNSRPPPTHSPPPSPHILPGKSICFPAGVHGVPVGVPGPHPGNSHPPTLTELGFPAKLGSMGPRLQTMRVPVSQPPQPNPQPRIPTEQGGWAILQPWVQKAAPIGAHGRQPQSEPREGRPGGPTWGPRWPGRGGWVLAWDPVAQPGDLSCPVPSQLWGQGYHPFGHQFLMYMSFSRLNSLTLLPFRNTN